MNGTKGDDSKTREGEKDEGDSADDKGARGDTDYAGRECAKVMNRIPVVEKILSKKKMT